ncbi:MAG TPA: hypothetical protein VNO30_18960, partial [Kofleriaceae bacterium]|nr:hypothetical protein [Kofleriaceae bacterium]
QEGTGQEARQEGTGQEARQEAGREEEALSPEASRGDLLRKAQPASSPASRSTKPGRFIDTS